MLVFDDADLDLALDGVLWGAFGTTGQRCTARVASCCKTGFMTNC
jgi:acyl-CoA reductase-like NAD-dependent aldehyde dehydrogenase